MANVTRVKIRRPDDFHVHLREDKMLEDVLPFTARVFGRALVMPNLEEPVTSARLASAYGERIVRVARAQGFERFRPLMTIKLVQGMDPGVVRAAKDAGVVACKLYPEGATTNSVGGVTDPVSPAMHAVYRAMEEVGLVLSVHAEEPAAYVLSREEAYLRFVDEIAHEHPRLRVVVEHVSTAAAVKFVLEAPGTVAATITAHHLVLTLDDVIGGALSPHNFCKPVAKSYVDRTVLLSAATGESPKFFLGTDSAPHSRGRKECASGCAGCFTAPVAIPLLAQLFEGRWDKLEAFASERGAMFYGLPLNDDFLELSRTSWRVTAPESGSGLVPFWEGKTLAWAVCP